MVQREPKTFFSSFSNNRTMTRAPQARSSTPNPLRFFSRTGGGKGEQWASSCILLRDGREANRGNKRCRLCRRQCAPPLAGTDWWGSSMLASAAANVYSCRYDAAGTLSAWPTSDSEICTSHIQSTSFWRYRENVCKKQMGELLSSSIPIRHELIPDPPCGPANLRATDIAPAEPSRQGQKSWFCVPWVNWISSHLLWYLVCVSRLPPAFLENTRGVFRGYPLHVWRISAVCLEGTSSVFAGYLQRVWRAPTGDF